MIEARKSAWFERVFAAYNRNLMARRFEGLCVAGLEHIERARGGGPLVLYANHSSWWDGLAAFEVGRACRLDHYVMMDERQLRRYKLFRKLGAFSVSREDGRAALRSVEYAARLLRETNAALWVFPQGETLPNDARPLRFHAGAARVIERAGAAVNAIPVAMRYEFLKEFRPEAFVRAGPARLVSVAGAAEAKHLTRDFEGELTRTLDHLRGDIIAGELSDYTEILAPRRRTRASAR